jgi:hypothetical protein
LTDLILEDDGSMGAVYLSLKLMIKAYNIKGQANSCCLRQIILYFNACHLSLPPGAYSVPTEEEK